ncbi:MAG: ATP-binding protein [Desulfobacterales bacterium]|nr:ATP-binding protein [Desulfobacterales bacterium]
MSFFPHLARFRHSFRIRIFLALTLIIILVIPGTGYFCYLQATRVIEKQLQEFALGSANQISKRVESFLSHHTFNVKLIRSLFEKGLIDMTDDKQIIQYFNLFQKDHPEFFNIYFGDETGRFLMSPAQVPEVHKTFDPRIRPWYQGALTTLDIHWTDVYLFASARKPGMTVSLPIYDTTQKLQAVCGIDIDISSFSQFLKGIKIGARGVAYIFDNKNGRIIAHPALVQQPWEPFHTDLLRSVHDDLKARSKRFGMSQFKGNQYFTAYTDYPGNDWTVGVTLPVSDLFENVFSIRRAIISLVIGGILLASLLSYLIAMTIVRPLTRLRQGIERISSGDLEYKVDIRDPDIAATLAGSFNRMAASLNKSSRELKRTYGELAQNEKLAAVGQMTAGIAHEIKNPLGIIRGSAQVVANPDRPIEMREKAAQFIMEEVDRLNHTLTAFLDFAKPPSPTIKPIDIRLLVEEITTILKTQYSDHEFKITTHGELPEIPADRDQLHQVFLNLFINAVQAMPSGGVIKILMEIRKQANTGTPPGSLEIAPAGPWPDQMKIDIIDKGCGISQEKLQVIFDPFVSFRDDGIGLGLPVVSQIIKSHKGKVEVLSIPGEGTRFTLIFPIDHQIDHQEDGNAATDTTH